MNVIEKWRALKGLVVDALTVGDEIVASLEGASQGDTFNETDLRYLTFIYDLERGLGDVSGSIIGPYQFSEIAWREAGEGDWRVNAIDPVRSARAALKYRDLNYDRFRRLYPDRLYSNAIAYLYHNQGPSGAAHFLSTGELRFPNQSKAALRLFETIKA